MKHIIAIDIGTQGTKCIIFDEFLKAKCASFEPSNLVSSDKNYIIQHPTEILQSVTASVSRVMARSEVSPYDVKVISVTGQMAGILGINKHAVPVTPYDSWLDTRCEPYIHHMKAIAGEHVVRLTGGQITYNHGPKMLWWKNEHPDTYASVDKFILLHVFVVLQMCGLTAKHAYIDETCLPFSGFADNFHMRWSEELIEFFDVDIEKLPKIVKATNIIGKTCEKFALSCGLISGIPVIAGMGDAIASAFGSGVTRKGMLHDCAGTASMLCCISNEYNPDVRHETLSQARMPISDRWLSFAYINGGGLCAKWFIENFTGSPCSTYEQLDSEAENIAPGSGGLFFIPHFSGRSLPMNPHVKGGFIGARPNHKRANLYRSILEGISYEYSYYMKLFEKNHPDVQFSDVYSSSGGSYSSLFCSIKADVLGYPVITYDIHETTLLGSALLAGYSIGIFDSCEEILASLHREKRVYTPKKESHIVYKQYADEYLRLISTMSEAGPK